MSRRRRITALIVGLLLLPSAASGGGSGCSMLRDSSGDMAMAATVIDLVHATHIVESAHSTHDSQIAVIEDDVDGGGSSSGRPHVPAECLSATACTGVALGVSLVVADDTARRVARVTPDNLQTPLSPALVLDPPPPRA